MQISIPNFADRTIKLLEACGHEAYCVGGCVRDSILGREPHDWDICTSANVDEIKDAFFGFYIIETGIKHGTLTVIVDRNPIEITTFRADGTYEKHRKPKQVKFVKNLSEDLLRRDFTMNALCYNSKTGIIDLFDGIRDIKNKIIRCVGDGEKRFDEDALRILRCLRFSSVLGFTIEENTKKAIFDRKNLLKFVSSERILNELYNLSVGNNVSKILLEYKEVFAEFIPEIKPCFNFKQNNPHHCFDVWEHICISVGHCRPEPFIRLALLFHDIAKPKMCTTDHNGINHFKKHQFESAKMTEIILKRLRCDTGSIKYICNLIWEHDNRIPPERKSVKKFISKYSFEFFMDYLEVRRADTYAQSDFKREEKLLELDELAMLGITIDNECTCLKISDLIVNGNDMISLGFEGKEIGVALKFILNAIIKETIKNDKEQILKFIGENRSCIKKEQ